MTTVLDEIRRKTRAARRRVRRSAREIDTRYPSLGRWLAYVTLALLVLLTIGLVAYALQGPGAS